MHKDFKYIGLIILLTILSFYIEPLNTQILTLSATNAQKKPSDSKKIDIKLDNTSVSYGVCNLYTLEENKIDFSKADYYAASLGASSFLEENNEAFIYALKNNMLKIYKNEQRLSIISDAPLPSDKKISSEEALTIGSQLYSDYFPKQGYEEVHVSLENGIYKISFIKRLENIRNMAFIDSVSLNFDGSFISIDHYFINYSLSGKANTISINEALKKLSASVDFENLSITNYMLVYVYDNNIIQPAYYFKGILNNEEAFEAYVPASKE